MPKSIIPAVTCDFAIVEFKKGRKALEKLVAKGEKITFTITGYLQPGSQSIGNDDGISTPFWADVQAIKLSV